MTERAKEQSAFCTRHWLFQFTRMLFGLSDTPGSFCHLMFNVLRDLLWEICLCYLDDIIIFGRTPQELLERMRTVLDRLRLVGQAFEMHAFQNPDRIHGSSCQCSWNSSHARQSQRSLWFSSSSMYKRSLIFYRFGFLLSPVCQRLRDNRWTTHSTLRQTNAFRMESTGTGSVWGIKGGTHASNFSCISDTKRSLHSRYRCFRSHGRSRSKSEDRWNRTTHSVLL